MLVQQENGKAGWLGNGSRNVSAAEAAAIEVESEDDDVLDPYSDVIRPPEVAFEAESSVMSSLGSWLMENLAKVTIVVFVFLSAVVLILMRSQDGQGPLLCVEKVEEELQRIPYPDLNVKHIAARVDKGRYAAMKTEKWIVVAALGAPTAQVQALTRVSGWQVVAVGGENTPADWKVPGAIFLSMADQAALGYRVVAHLPENNFLRKNIGYLFAIQHGAQTIYDADEHESVIGDDLDSRFDVYLQGRREPMLQFRSLPNRTVVNPFIHFGQKSVWPRGFPLEFVQEITPDISYSEVYPGRQFIQQGLANGLPDVDSIFYNTRRSHDGTININFDTNAPSVALPHGTLAPCNAFNTLFHSSAFWGLMLPVTLSPKAADIVRGYWAQRILWEIGGMMVIYPPTTVRDDTGTPLSFLDEKDLHAESRRLAQFLVSWRSPKTSTLFDKIVHLTHNMAEEGFWGAQDVELLTDWLKDLLSVGWRQPRLVGSDLDAVVVTDTTNPSAAHKQFVPRSFPTVHLGVDDATSLTEEFIDFLKWRKFYGNMILILECTWPLNHTVLSYRLLYGRLFKHVVVLSQENEPNLGVRASDWWLSYSSLPKIFEKYPFADGFVVMKEAVVLNYWHLAESANKTKLWSLHQTNTTWQRIDFNQSGSEWYLGKGNRNGVKKLVSRLPVEYRTTYKETMDDDHFIVSTFDVFYLPRRYVDDFAALVPLAGKMKLHRDLALPIIFMAMENVANFDAFAFSSVKALTEKEELEDPAISYTPEWHAVYPWAATSDVELYRIIKAMSAGDPSLADIIE